MLFFINTAVPYQEMNDRFKYISCYSLSLCSLPALSLAFVFKYISCYSLSLQGQFQYLIDQDLNTSHVILYLVMQTMLKVMECHLNTSHVILYREFIKSQRKQSNAFKYISCYSLSESSQRPFQSVRNLNTSHVILYPQGRFLYEGKVMIFKYISCYSLSCK